MFRPGIPQYEVARKTAADQLGIRASVLDELRSQKRRELKLDGAKTDDGQGRTLALPEVMPWPEPIEGDRVAETLKEAGSSSTDHGGGKRRGAGIVIAPASDSRFVRESPRPRNRRKRRPMIGATSARHWRLHCPLQTTGSSSVNCRTVGQQSVEMSAAVPARQTRAFSSYALRFAGMSALDRRYQRQFNWTLQEVSQDAFSDLPNWAAQGK
jgi:hypothetical protein